MPEDYPKAMYRAGTEYLVWNLYSCDFLPVADADDEATAAADGWVTTPDATVPAAPVAKGKASGAAD